MEFVAPDIQILPLVPVLVIAVTALLVLLRGVFTPADKAPYTAGLSLTGLSLAAVCTILAIGGSAFGGMLNLDLASACFWIVFFVATAFTIRVIGEQLSLPRVERAEVHALLLLSCLGMMLMASAGHLVMIFLGLETMSIALYILAGLVGSQDEGSNEAALKYLLLGAFATGFLLYGMAFLYGATGQLSLGGLASSISGGGAIPGFLSLGLGLVIVGLGFKVAVVPFHMWAPDVYEGSPTPVSAFMSVGPKVAGFAAMVRVFDQAGLAAVLKWAPVLAVLAVLTMFVGNVVAIAQTNVKRMLAYSSIAHAGYLLVGVTAANETGVAGVLFYSLVYGLMNLGAFAVVMLVQRGHLEGLHLDDYKGLSRRRPVLAASMALFMFSLAGVPPFSGFLGKWLLFSGAVQGELAWLAVCGVLASAISAFFYLRLVVLMWMDEPADDAPDLPDRPFTRHAVCLLAIATLVVGVPLGLWLVQVAQHAAAGIF